jgi:hypothetical protein
MTHHPCQRRDGFTWSRNPAGGKDRDRIVYMLFWRDEKGKVYMLSEAFKQDEDRRFIAQTLRRIRNNARVMRQALRIAA